MSADAPLPGFASAAPAAGRAAMSADVPPPGFAPAAPAAGRADLRERPLLAVISPRLAEGGAVGGAETLLFNLATLAAAAGLRVEFLTTCAKNHFTWANELPPGEFVRDGVKVIRFPVNQDRDADLFNSLQMRIGQGETLSEAEEEAWLRNSVNSDALMDYAAGAGFDRILTGPYLFGLALTASARFPDKTVLVPCLHDEPFARVRLVERMFHSVHAFCFNTAQEQALAERLFFKGAEAALSDTGLAPAAPAASCASLRERPHSVIGFSLPDFASSAERGHALAGGDAPYLLYCGRREPLKGTPLLVDYWAAFRALHPESNLKFVFTGFGDIERPEGLESEIIDLGFVGEQEKHDLMAGALAFCHASVNESLGIVLLETWLARRPCLVFASGEVLTAQTRAAGGGLWFRTCAEFNAAVEFLLESPAAASALGESGRAWTLANYSAPAVTERLLNLLQR